MPGPGAQASTTYELTVSRTTPSAVIIGVPVGPGRGLVRAKTRDPPPLARLALLLTQLHGPPDSDHSSHLLHDGARGDLLDASPSHAERHRSATNRSTCTVASANRSLACRAPFM